MDSLQQAAEGIPCTRGQCVVASRVTPSMAHRQGSWRLSRVWRSGTPGDSNGKTITTSYCPDDDPDMDRRGNVATVTDALNHVTRFTAYNLHGQPTQIVDPNGFVTDLTYDLKLPLTRRKVGNELTTFSYEPMGSLKKVTLPDQASVTYTYEAAHRLVAIADQQVNPINYTHDAMGDRITEKATDSGGTLVKNIQRTIDALNVSGSQQSETFPRS